MSRKRWEPRGGWASSDKLTPKDARRVYYVMRTRRKYWPGTETVLAAVKRYEKQRRYGTIGATRIRAALRFLVKYGYITVDARKPFQRMPDYRKHYTVVDPSRSLPDDIQPHEPRRPHGSHNKKP